MARKYLPLSAPTEGGMNPRRTRRRPPWALLLAAFLIAGAALFAPAPAAEAQQTVPVWSATPQAARLAAPGNL